MLNDIRYALRLLRRSPGFSLVVILVLGIGIGVNVLAFALFKALALTPLAGVAGSAALHVIVSRTQDGRQTALSYPDYRHVRDHDRTHQGVAGSLMQGYSLGRGANARLIYGELVTGNYFQVLGVRAQLGRTLLPSDDLVALGHPVAVIGDSLWRRSFGADPAIVGRTIELGTHVLTVVGVAAPDFRGALPGIATEVYVPVAMQPLFSGGLNVLEDRTRPLLYAFGRPRDGVTLAAARADAALMSAALTREASIDGITDRATVVTMWRSPYGAQTYMLPAVGAMGGTAALLLVVVCANIGGLVLIRGISRQRETAARLTLGASRWRVVRLLLCETLLLALPGAWLGLWLPRLAAPFIERAQTNVSLPLYFNVEGGSVPAFALVLGVFAALLCGLMPVLKASQVDLVAAMKDDTAAGAAGAGRLRTALVVAQVAMGLVLLVGTGLAVRSLDAARRADAGFIAEGVASVALDVLSSGRDTSAGRAFYEQLLNDLRSDPGVTSVAVAKMLPLAMVEFDTLEVLPEGYRRQRGDDLRFLFNVVGDDYFETLRIGLAAGREFGQGDHAEGARVAIVNETLARRFWGTAAAALGKRLQTDAASPGLARWLTIVGVARDIKYVRLTEVPRPYVYLPFAQAYNPTMFVQARSAAGAAAPVARVRQHIAARDPQQAIIMAGTLADQTRMGLAVYDVTARTLGIIGVAGLGLAALGIYGTIAFTVRQRAHEIGIRLAIGAPRASILRRYLAAGLRLGGMGAVIGVAMALSASRIMTGLLYGVTALDGTSFIAAGATVLTVAAAAAFLPAWRASRADPVTTLRRS